MGKVIQLFEATKFNATTGWQGLFASKKPTVRFSRFFSVDSAKAIKATKYNWLNGINYMAPADFASNYAKQMGFNGKIGTVCSDASKGCKQICLGSESGQAGIRKEGELNATMRSRINKVIAFFHHHQEYMLEMVYHIAKLIATATAKGMQACVRLNGASDIAYEKIKIPAFGNKTVFEIFPDTQFVDYTKKLARLGKEPANLSLTFSLSEENASDAKQALLLGYNVAVIFADFLPETYTIDGHTVPVINGDEHDLRHLDPRRAGGFVVGLLPKGHKAKKDQTGFVVRDHAGQKALNRFLLPAKTNQNVAV